MPIPPQSNKQTMTPDAVLNQAVLPQKDNLAVPPQEDSLVVESPGNGRDLEKDKCQL